MTAAFRIYHLFIVDVFDGGKAGSHRREGHSLKRVHHDDTILRTFILFVQTAHAVLKYADAHFYRKARLSVIKYIVNRVMLSISEGDAVPLEKSLRVLRQNAHDGLEHVAKHSQRRQTD